MASYQSTLSAPAYEVHADVAPLSPIYSKLSVAAVVAGLGLIAVSAATTPASASSVQTYTVAAQTARPVGVSAAVRSGMPTAQIPRHSLANAAARQSEVIAEADSAPNSLPKSTGTLKVMGWMTTMCGAAMGVAVLLWNQMSAANQEILDSKDELAKDLSTGLATLGATAVLLSSAGPAYAERPLPPLDNDPNRCERGLVGNTIGQANGVSDRALDLRLCDLSNQDLKGKTLSGALMVDTNFSGSNMQEAILSKVYAPGASFKNVDFTSAVLDRGIFDKADMSGSNFYNAVITGATFEGTNLKDTSFEEALIGSEDAKRLCANPTLVGESRDSVGCRD